MRKWRSVILAASVLSGTVNTAPAHAAQRWQDDLAGRREVFVFVERFNSALLAGRSATATLETWCADHHMARPARIRAILDRKATRQASPTSRALLKVDSSEPVNYRRVALACGTHVLSLAENWYVPSRLTPEMNRLLETTDTPFGRVVSALQPVRQTLSVERLWSPLPADRHDEAPKPSRTASPRELTIPAQLIRHHAILIDIHHRPIAEVVETYTGELLNFTH